MGRFFNTAGPCEARRHYMLPPEARLPGLDRFVEREQTFVLHAPRQTGKTTAMRAWAERLRGAGYVALTATLETSQGVQDTDAAEQLWMAAISAEAAYDLDAASRPPPARSVDAEPPGARLAAWLAAWSAAVDRPIVLLLDEADVVRGPPLVNLLRQLRARYPHRGAGRFPVCIGLVGMRDLRDYLAAAKDGEPISPGSPFNIKAESFTLRTFTEDEVQALLLQHTADTGQVWTEGALRRVFEQTQGQPYLVNAIADRATTHLVPDRATPIDERVVDRAIEALILARVTHIDHLAERLKEPRVARIIQAILLGDDAERIDFRSDDFQYAVDLGLVTRSAHVAEISNPLYREVLARELAANRQDRLPAPWWPYKRPDGRLDVPALVAQFLRWWRENADMLLERDDTPDGEAAAHLAFMGFLQRVVNGGGTVEREYAAARGRVDLVVRYAGERHVFELKRVSAHRGLEHAIDQGSAQLSGYLAVLGVTEGWLLIFDPRPGRTWTERLWSRDDVVEGRTLHLRGA